MSGYNHVVQLMQWAGGLHLYLNISNLILNIKYPNPWKSLNVKCTRMPFTQLFKWVNMQHTVLFKS